MELLGARKHSYYKRDALELACREQCSRFSFEFYQLISFHSHFELVFEELNPVIFSIFYSKIEILQILLLDFVHVFKLQPGFFQIPPTNFELATDFF